MSTIRSDSNVKNWETFEDCPLCGGDVGYSGVEDGHGDSGEELADVYVCRDCDFLAYSYGIDVSGTI